MKDNEFCRIMREFDGEPMDKVEQLTHMQFTGRELKEFCDHVESQVTNRSISGVVESLPNADEITDASIEHAELPDDCKLDDPRIFTAAHFVAGATWYHRKVKKQ